MAGYTRQSLADIQDGQDIVAGPLNDEFDALQSAFNGTTGHSHDGTTGNSPKIELTAAAAVNGILPVANGGTGASDAATARTNLGLAIGTNVQAYDAGLQSISGLTTAADTMIYTTALDVYATTALTPFARTLLDDTTAANWLTTLGVSAFVQTIFNDADAATVRATIGADNATNLTSGTVADARMPTSMAGKTFTSGVIVSAGGLSVTGSEIINTNGSTLSIQRNNANAIDIEAYQTTNPSVKHSIDLNRYGGAVTIGGNTVWHAGNDGAGSGLDADLLDGQSSAYYTDIVSRLGYTPLNKGGDTMGGTLGLLGFAGSYNAFQIGNADAASYSSYNFALKGWYGMGMIAHDDVVRGYYDFRTGTWDTLGGSKKNGVAAVYNDSGTYSINITGNSGNSSLLNGLGNSTTATGNSIMQRDGSGNTAVNTITAGTVNYSSDLLIDKSGSEVWRWNGDGALVGGVTVTKTSITDAGTGISLSQGGVLWVSRSATVQGLFNRDTNDGVSIQFGRSKVVVGSISVTTTATAYNTSSDVRLKQDFQPINPALLDLVKVYDFEWKADGTRAYGVKAQELYEVIPTAVTKGETEEDMWGVDYMKLVPLLIAKVQDLEARLKALES